MSSYNVQLNRWNGTSYDTINPATKAELVQYQDGTTGEQNKVRTLTFTLPTQGWTTITDGYEINITVSGVTSQTQGVAGVATNATKAQYLEASECNIRVLDATTNSLHIVAYEKVPTVEIPMQLVVTR